MDSIKRWALILLLSISDFRTGNAWGFFAHQKVTLHAIFLLPPEMLGFYKKHQETIVRRSVNPDKRRYILEDEGPRHYIDLENYHGQLQRDKPMSYHQALKVFSKDTLLTYGMVPWQILITQKGLVNALKKGDRDRIIRYSADLSHYIGDCHVPLHTTENYNGQLTGQRGIHGLWESRLPELYFQHYDLLVGPVNYEDNPQTRIWQTMWASHDLVVSVLRLEKEITMEVGVDKKYTFEIRKKALIKTFSRDFCVQYNRALGGQVEDRFRSSVKMVADFWYSAWIEAGQPDLSALR